MICLFFRFLALSFPIIVISGCGSGSGDFHELLVGDYYYYDMGGAQRFIAPSKWNKSTPMIPSEIVHYKVVGNIILAKRRVLKDAEFYRSQMNDQKPLKHDYDYWLLDTENTMVAGQLSFEEFKALGEKNGLEIQDRKWLRIAE